MTKKAWILGVVAVVLGGLVYWFEYGPGTRPDVRMEKRDVVHGEGFEVAVPKGFALVTDERMQIPKGAVALARATRLPAKAASMSSIASR